VAISWWKIHKGLKASVNILRYSPPFLLPDIYPSTCSQYKWQGQGLMPPIPSVSGHQSQTSCRDMCQR